MQVRMSHRWIPRRQNVCVCVCLVSVHVSKSNHFTVRGHGRRFSGMEQARRVQAVYHVSAGALSKLRRRLKRDNRRIRVQQTHVQMGEEDNLPASPAELVDGSVVLVEEKEKGGRGGRDGGDAFAAQSQQHLLKGFTASATPVWPATKTSRNNKRSAVQLGAVSG